MTAVDTDAPRHDDERWAARAFAALAIVGSAFLLFVVGRYVWFFHDEWNFLALRTDDGWSEIFQPHHEHWATLPILVYKALYAVVGLRSYLPYEVPVLAAHVGSAVLLRIVMRRAGVRPWVATAAAALFLFLGEGMRNILGGFQIAFTGALFFGLVHLLLADHDGPTDRRDWLGLAAGALALLFSGVGVALGVVVGLATLARRGWRLALLHTAPLAVLYLVWYLSVRPAGPGNPQGESLVHIVGVVVVFVVVGLARAFVAVGYVLPVGVALVAVLVVGLLLAWRPLSRDELRRTAVLPAALLVGAVVFLGIAGIGRWNNGFEAAAASRYLHLGVAFVLPALAVAADAVMKRWNWATPVIAVLFAVGLVGNLAAFRADGARTPAFYEHNEQIFLGMARSPLAAEVPRDSHPHRAEAPFLTIGWLVDAHDAGKTADPGPLDAAVEGEIEIRLGLAQQRARPEGVRCRRTDPGPIDLTPAVGDALRFENQRLEVVNLAVPEADRVPVEYEERFGRTLLVQLPDLELRVTPRGKRPVAVCS